MLATCVESTPDVATRFASDFMEMLDGMARPHRDGVERVFHATLDDVGTCQQDGIAAYAGLIAEKDQWNKFNSHWQFVLDQLGQEYLHTAHYLSRFPLIGGAGKDESDDYLILKPFIDVVRGEILNAGGFGLVVVTECDGYNALTEQEKKYIRPPKQNSFELFIGHVCMKISPVLGRHNPIAFEMDDSDNAQEMLGALESFILLKKSNDLYRRSLGGIAFVDDQMLRAAQAADMLANLALKGWRTDGRKQGWPKAFNALVNPGGVNRIECVRYNGAALKRMAADRKAAGAKVTQVASVGEYGNETES